MACSPLPPNSHSAVEGSFAPEKEHQWIGNGGAKTRAVCPTHRKGGLYRQEDTIWLGGDLSNIDSKASTPANPPPFCPHKYQKHSELLPAWKANLLWCAEEIYPIDMQSQICDSGESGHTAAPWVIGPNLSCFENRLKNQGLSLFLSLLERSSLDAAIG
ncbi:G Antigen Family E Member 3-Like [Manis pentadactyla]|nr:G Antigen Family E Member 3-Like [Manis pentadactyla]